MIRANEPPLFISLTLRKLSIKRFKNGSNRRIWVVFAFKAPQSDAISFKLIGTYFGTCFRFLHLGPASTHKLLTFKDLAMISPVCINFSLRNSKTLSNGTAPIYLRLTVAGLRIEFSTRQYIKPQRWSQSKQRMTGTNEEALNFNHFLKSLEQRVFDAQRQMLTSGETITAESLKNKLLGKEEKKPEHMLVAIFKEHNHRLKALVGSEYASGTLERYQTSLKHTIDFMQWQYQTTDIAIEAINHEFITSYDFYLRSQRGCSNNTTVKYIKNFKKIIRICIANGWLQKDPFVNYTAKTKEVKRDYLIEEEIRAIAEKEFQNQRIDQVRDIFLFCCYTGLSYADVKKLKRTEIVIGIDKQYWISTSRQKTDTPSRIPLIPAALTILEKYRDSPEACYNQTALPVLSNQKMNSYLKEIADLCGISKLLTFHIARHSFATSVTLANGVSIESVSKMLGHKNIRTTQHYAKILDSKVSEDMKMLRRKLEGEQH